MIMAVSAFSHPTGKPQQGPDDEKPVSGTET
jgi:hypothetical protein